MHQVTPYGELCFTMHKHYLEQSLTGNETTDEAGQELRVLLVSDPDQPLFYEQF